MNDQRTLDDKVACLLERVLALETKVELLERALADLRAFLEEQARPKEPPAKEAAPRGHHTRG